MKQAPPSDDCPCGSGRRYDACCGPLHAGAAAASAEALMRSRYSAYVRKLAPYLLATWHPSTRPAQLDLSADTTTWLGLKIRRSEQKGDAATVEFIARLRHGGASAQRMHEISHFVREQGRWTYVDGDFPGVDDSA